MFWYISDLIEKSSGSAAAKNIAISRSVNLTPITLKQTQLDLNKS
jgi:hypothetical protein